VGWGGGGGLRLHDLRSLCSTLKRRRKSDQTREKWKPAKKKEPFVTKIHEPTKRWRGDSADPVSAHDKKPEVIIPVWGGVGWQMKGGST